MITLEPHYNIDCSGGDPFETPETRARGDWYGVHGVPVVWIDGSRNVLGASNCETAYNAYLDAISERLAETGGLSPIAIEGQYVPHEFGIDVLATCRLVDPASLAMLQATIVVIESNIYAADPEYFDDTWNHVVRMIHNQEITLVNQGDEAVIAITLPLDPEWNTDEIDVVALVQQNGLDLEIYQGALLERYTSAIEEDGIAAALATGIDLCNPNPFYSQTEIGFFLTPEAVNRPVRVEVFDFSGRRITSLLNGRVSPGAHTLTWDGRNDLGVPVGNGVYLVRLDTWSTSRSEKLVLIRD